MNVKNIQIAAGSAFVVALVIVGLVLLQSQESGESSSSVINRNIQNKISVPSHLDDSAEPKSSPSSISKSSVIQSSDNNPSLPDSYNDIINRIQRLRDVNVNPCDDFYQYACGSLNITWNDNDTGSYIDSFNSIENSVNKQISSILTGYFPFVSTAYLSCMSSVSGQAVPSTSALKPWLDLIGTITNPQSLMQVIGQLDRHNMFGGLLNFDYDDFSVWADSGYTGTVSIDFVGSKGALNTAYSDGRLARLISLIDPTLDSQQAAQQLYDFLNNLQLLAKSGSTYQSTLKDFTQSTFFPLTEYFEGFAIGGPQHGLGQKIDLLTQISKRPIQFSNDQSSFRDLLAFISTPSSSTFAIWQLYLKVILYRNAMGLLPTQYQDVWCLKNNTQQAECFNTFKLLAFASAHSSSLDNEAVCSTYVSYVFQNLLAHEWIAQDYANSTKTAISDMVGYLYQIMGQRINKNTWLDNDTRQKAMAKWSLLVRNVGYNDDYNQYVPLDVTLIGDPMWDLSASLGYVGGVKYARVNDVFPRNMIPSGGLKAWDANAFYFSLTNSINMIPGLQYAPFFSTDYPKMLNIATYGWVIGHEMTHGFDSNGRNYDGIGQRVNWWSFNSTQAFETRSQCLINQYSQFPVLDTHLDGTKTLAENIADNGGIGIAWDAYKVIYASTNNPDTPANQAVLSQLQKDLSLNLDQIFYLWAGQTWCSSFSKKAQQDSLQYDVHSLPKFRVLGAFSNQLEFAQAWNCPATAQMGRSLTDQACHIW